MMQRSRAKKLINLTRGYLKRLDEEGIRRLPIRRKSASSGAQSKTSPIIKKKTRREELITLREEVLKCVRCDELVKNRNKIVFGAGHAEAKLCFVGEAPGFEEDKQGVPFVGRAGQLLTKMIESIGLTRRQVFICNVLKCRPPGNRNPHPEEILNCEPYLVRQLDAIRPKLICALGSFAAQTLLKTGQSVSRMRGKIYDYHGVSLIVTFHPAYLLRNPGDKRKAWEDLKLLRRELGKHRK